MIVRTYAAKYAVHRQIDRYKKFYFVPVCAMLVVLVIIREILPVFKYFMPKWKALCRLYVWMITGIENKGRFLFALIRNPYRNYQGSLIPAYLYYQQEYRFH